MRILKDVVKRLAGRLGYEIVRPEWLLQRALPHHLRRLFLRYEIDCVLDVGANRGQYYRFLRDEVGYRGAVISFEPLAANAERLRALAAADPRWSVHGFALGDEERAMDLHVMKADDFSSFLAPDASVAPEFRERNVVDHEERVEVRRLDRVLPQLRRSQSMQNVYLKMDTQGFDLAVAAGAGDELLGFRALQTELSVRPLYVGMPGYREVLAWLEQRGFALSGMFPVTKDAALRVIEFDGIMVNAARPPGGASS